jgi:hypothetical protein
MCRSRGRLSTWTTSRCDDFNPNAMPPRAGVTIRATGGYIWMSLPALGKALNLANAGTTVGF